MKSKKLSHSKDWSVEQLPFHAVPIIDPLPFPKLASDLSVEMQLLFKLYWQNLQKEFLQRTQLEVNQLVKSVSNSQSTPTNQQHLIIYLIIQNENFKSMLTLSWLLLKYRDCRNFFHSMNCTIQWGNTILYILVLAFWLITCKGDGISLYKFNKYFEIQILVPPMNSSTFRP